MKDIFIPIVILAQFTTFLLQKIVATYCFMIHVKLKLLESLIKLKQIN